jgi:hypothetical protein
VLNNIAPAGTTANRGVTVELVFSGNRFFFGFENENLGNGSQLWPEVQLNAMGRAAAALCRAHGWNQIRVIGHKEWTARKPDPVGIDIVNFRTAIEVILQGG